MKAHELRTSIIQYAIKGHLVPQSKDDGTANEILESALKKKKELIEEKILKNKEQSLPIVPAEMIFEKPQNWEWARVNSLFAINPKNAIEDETDVGFVPMRMIEDGFQNKHGYEVKSWKNIKKGYTHFQESDIAIAKITPCFENRKSVILKDLPNNHGAGTTEIFVLRPYTDKINLKYFLYIFKNQEFISSGIKSFTGTAGHQRVSKSFLDNYIIALPPKKEQDRIVHKLEELLNKIDQYDKLEQKIAILNTDFPSNMEKSILQYAMEGKLVPQDPCDENLNLLLDKVNNYGSKKHKKPMVTKNEIPFSIPDSWRWVRLKDLGVIKTGTTPPVSNKEYYGNYIPFVKPGDIQENFIDYDNQKLSKLGLEKGRLIEKDSLLMVCIGGSRGKCFYTNQEVSCNQQINTLTPAKDLVNLKYIYYILSSNYFYDLMIHKATGTATPIVNKTNWSNTIIPLCPIKEQERIVDKIEELFNYTEKIRIY